LSVQQQQLLNLFLLLLLGSFFSNLYLSWYEILGLLVFTFVFDITVGCFPRKHRQNQVKISFNILTHITRCFRGKPPTIYSSLITAIGVMLMMASSQFYIYFIIIALALLQKHYLKINNQHFFNPSNFALIMALFFFYDEAHIVLGQLGDELWLALLLGVMAIAILVRVNRWLISLCFTVFYLLFQYWFIVSSDPVLIMEEIYHRFYSVSFILFILFMLTDPRTTPSKNYYQISFALLIALFTVGLDYLYGFRVQHLFLSLFFFSLFTPILEHRDKRNKALYTLTFLLFVLVTMVIINIESQAPYYFEMNG
jgi:hypothetical protein